MSLKRKLMTLTTITLGGTAAFGAISFLKNDEKFYKQFVMPTLHLLDPETSHKLAIFMSKYRLIGKTNYVDPESLKIRLFGKELSNPIGIAAGFDKNGEAVLGLQDMGFGFIEIGSVTPKAQVGNEKPRVFRLKEDLAVINRYGFNSDGHEEVYNRIKALRDKKDAFNRVLGINLGKNKDSDDAIADYVDGIKKFGPLADYLVINISSPNTLNLRQLQDKNSLKPLLRSVLEARNGLEGKQPLIFLKLAPDLTANQRVDVANVIKQKEYRVDGLIISNTSIERPTTLQSDKKIETGGLSGQPIKDVSTQMIAEMYRLTNGMPIIGVGGISSGEDAYEKIRAGAIALQIYTALIYEGPPIVTKIKQQLHELIANEKLENVREAVGTATNATSN